MLTKRIRTFLSLDRHTVLLFIEAFLFLGLAKLQLLRTFAKVAPKLGSKTEETSLQCDDKHIQTLKRVRSAISVMSRHTFWDSKCLVQAMAGMKMLERRDIPSTLYLGTARDENGKLIAHAWLRSGSLYVSGSEVMNKFVVVEKFAKHAN
ncbi:lasso peptide biosynthesis B2 protein [Paenibacillus sp. LHD-117]|uniref:lasso peptide biosynthesis B2 protein n=1 Tax=Paenibacillus sp. LHD-117 TaxID=3071412 RepID=UPI0027E1DC4B|nr:lasso peptide biosynthesis B2 protein [Paenibacillus sp. LHD-117]MDQ6422373.1 lasso peptide biosynthesis B2 protein [Paenibacillus sp. LHD-117]